MEEPIITIEVITVDHASQELHSYCALTLKYVCLADLWGKFPFKGHMITSDTISEEMNYKLQVLLLHKL